VPDERPVGFVVEPLPPPGEVWTNGPVIGDGAPPSVDGFAVVVDANDDPAGIANVLPLAPTVAPDEPLEVNDEGDADVEGAAVVVPPKEPVGALENGLEKGLVKALGPGLVAAGDVPD